MSENSGHMISMMTATIKLTWANDRAANDKKHTMEVHQQGCYTQNVKECNTEMQRNHRKQMNTPREATEFKTLRTRCLIKVKLRDLY